MAPGISSPAALELLAEVWAIRPESIASLWAAATGTLPREATVAGPTTSRARSGGSTATLFVRGPISRRPSFFSMFFGGTTVEELSAQLAEAVADPSVDDIVLNIDSPGGSTDGITELAAEVYAARQKKTVTAMVDTAASAAYWIGSQATQLHVTPSGQVGSIGVFSLHMDQSKALEAAGVVPTFIHAGKYKVESNPLQPLSDDAKAEIQRKVDAAYSMFVRDVARGRGIPVDAVRSQFGEGRMVLAKDAVALGMADNIRSATATSSTRASIDAGALLAIAHANASRINRSMGGERQA